MPGYERQKRLLPKKHAVLGPAQKPLPEAVTAPANTTEPTSADLPTQRIGHGL